MITKHRMETILHSIRDKYTEATTKMINDLDCNKDGFPETISINLDRWMMNDLNVLLRKYRKEIENNDP